MYQQGYRPRQPKSWIYDYLTPEQYRMLLWGLIGCGWLVTALLLFLPSIIKAVRGQPGCRRCGHPVAPSGDGYCPACGRYTT